MKEMKGMKGMKGMAKQGNVVKLEGTIGGLSFYKSQDGYRAREKAGVSVNLAGAKSIFAPENTTLCKGYFFRRIQDTALTQESVMRRKRGDAIWRPGVKEPRAIHINSPSGVL